ncbi:MAG: hypothetical protein HQL76_00275 [Magnetococcales bacterium]|nr:hypothetical protein [Magnetococcales bacterium]
MVYRTLHPDRCEPFGHFGPEVQTLLGEIFALCNSLHAIENDMEHSIRNIRQAAFAFSEPRRQRLRLLVEALARKTRQSSVEHNNKAVTEEG